MKPCVDKKDTSKKQGNKIEKYRRKSEITANKRKRSRFFSNSLLFQKFYAPEMRKQPFVDGVKPLSTSPPERPAKPGGPVGFAFPATVTFASFASGSLVVMAIAFSIPFDYTRVAISRKENDAMPATRNLCAKC